jgi:hypothetical protein
MIFKTTSGSGVCSTNNKKIIRIALLKLFFKLDRKLEKYYEEWHTYSKL